ncbi:MAG: hypothetical protein ABR582_16900 [Gemmatimonadaceae bacterium]
MAKGNRVAYGLGLIFALFSCAHGGYARHPEFIGTWLLDTTVSSPILSGRESGVEMRILDLDSAWLFEHIIQYRESNVVRAGGSYEQNDGRVTTVVRGDTISRTRSWWEGDVLRTTIILQAPGLDHRYDVRMTVSADRRRLVTETRETGPGIDSLRILVFRKSD